MSSADMFGVRGRAFAQLLSAVLGILFFGLIVWGSFEPLLHALDQRRIRR